MPERVTSFGYVEAQDKFALMFCSAFHSHGWRHVTLTLISSKLPLVRSLLRPSRDSGRRSNVMQCPTTSHHDSTCGEVCFCVATEYCDTHIMCLSVEHAAELATPLSWLYVFTAADVIGRNFSRTRMLLQWKSLTSCHHQMIQDAAQHMSVLATLPRFS